MLDRPLIVRAASLYIPICVALILWMSQRVSKRRAAGILLASGWNVSTLFILHLLALRLGWWRYEAQGGLFYGFPVDLYLGWVVLWGILPGMLSRRIPMPLVIAAAFALDVIAMPLCAPVVALGPNWLIGEVAALLLCLWPAQMVFRWTSGNTNLKGRASLQVIAFAIILIVVVPAIAISQSTEHRYWPLDSPTWMRNIILQILFLPVLFGMIAVREFVERGHGTPIPYDPPERLVTSGVYAYCANPMQLSATALLLLMGAVLLNIWLLLAGVVAFAYSAGLANWDEGEDLRRRFGAAWLEYRQNVRPWAIRWRPWYPSLSGRASRARLYVAAGCGPCSEVASWFARRKTIGLEIVAAEDHPRRDLTRITYDPSDGTDEVEGVAAVARAFEHIDFGLAFLGFFMRLPVVCGFLQLLVDASGMGPQLIPRRLACALSTEDGIHVVETGEWRIAACFRGEFL